MTDLEARLRSELHRRAEAIDPSPDLPLRIRAEVRRRERRRRAAGSAAAVAAVAVLAGGASAGVLALRGSQPSVTRVATRPPAAGGLRSSGPAAGGPSASRAGSAASPTTIVEGARVQPNAKRTGQPGKGSSPTTGAAPGGGSSPSTLASAPATTASNPSECATSDLAARIAPAPGESGAGNQGATLVLTNTSPVPCGIHGYVGLLELDAQGNPIRSRAARGSTYFHQDPGPQDILLQSGQSASADMAWSDVAGAGEPPTGACEPQAASLEITPPNEVTQLVVPFHETVCEHGTLHVTALVPGPGGP